MSEESQVDGLDLFWFALNYRTAISTDEAARCWHELVDCVNRLIEIGERVEAV